MSQNAHLISHKFNAKYNETKNFRVPTFEQIVLYLKKDIYRNKKNDFGFLNDLKKFLISFQKLRDQLIHIQNIPHAKEEEEEKSQR